MRLAYPSCFLFLLGVAACGGGGGIEDYYPELPDPTGGPQEAYAGEITTGNAGELVAGPAATGMVGDFFIRNDRASFIVSAPARVIGVVPQGGNLIDIVLRDSTGQVVDDHFGELAMLYVLGRTCEHDSVEILRDGSEGGIAAIRAHGFSGNDDFLNIKGIGLLNVEAEVDPDIDDGVECATTYVLYPGATSIQVYFTLYNPTDSSVQGPMGTLADTGGTVESWGNLRGFERLGLSIDALSLEAPLDYTVYQGPGVSYGILPRDPLPAVNSAYLIAGVSVFLFGNATLLDILNRDKYYLHLEPKKGLLQQIEVAVGRDAEDIDVAYRSGKGESLTPIGGTVTWSTGSAATGARVGVFRDDDGDGQIGDNDKIVSYMDVADDGSFSGQVPAGNHLLRAEVKDQGRSAASPAGAQVGLTIPAPVRVDYNILDHTTGMAMPGRLLVMGDHPAFPDKRLFETYDRLGGVVTQVHAIRGSSTLGADPDPPLTLPAGGNYRIYASRGTEYSVASQPVSGTADTELTFRLRDVSPTPGYLATEWHVHQIGSPDSPVPSDVRVRSAASAGVEMFAVTDHDYVSDLEPIVEELGLQDVLRVIPGIEVTPFAYGHFNAWPMNLDASSPNHGAVDWAQGGMEGFAMLPGEIYGGMRSRGAQMVQINHPRASSSFSEFQSFFDRANLTYDYANRTIFGDFATANVPNDFLRLPGTSLWDDSFNGLEVWNGFRMVDSDADGVRENQSQDRVLRDWMNMLSLGKVVTPAGNIDTHTSVADPVGMPRTMVGVTDDSGAALASGAASDAVLAAMTGSAPRDVIVTNGPMIQVRSGGAPAIGRTLDGAGGVTLTVTVTSPDWAEIDTIEVFANTTPDIVANDGLTAITPLRCWTSRPLGSLDPADRCLDAAMAPQSASIQLVTLAGGGNFRRYEATITVTLDAADIVNRAGASGTDAWLVFRVRGDRGVFPLLTNSAIDATTLPIILAGNMDDIATALRGKGVAASAFTAPIFVDFDGGGYRAPFAP